MAKNILVLAPHADDEILGCGGTIARYIQQNERVYVSILTNASVGAPEIYDSEMIEKVRSEALLAHKLLGISETFFFDLPAPQLEQHPQYQIASLILKIINDVQPEVLFVPHRGDLHLDHGAVFNAAMVAARPQRGMTVKSVLAYETLSETDWAHPFPDTTFIPNFFVKLTESQLGKKLEAMKVFSSQLKDFPHPRSIRAIDALARIRGSTVGAASAESFMSIRIVE